MTHISARRIIDIPVVRDHEGVLMKRKIRVLSVCFALTVSLAFFIAAPTTSVAANPVNITGATNVAAIQTEIQDEINAFAVGGGTVEVIGTFTGADDTLEFYIPDGVKVIWYADYAGAAEDLIYVRGSGAGVFEVADGVILNAYSSASTTATAINTDNVSLLVTGSDVRVEATGTGGAAIYSGSDEAWILDGTLTSSGDGSYTLFSYAGDLHISGNATVVSNGLNSIAVYNRVGDIYLESGGRVISTGNDSYAIRTDESGVIWVTGGGISVYGERSFGIYSQTGLVFLDCQVYGGLILVASNDSKAVYSHSGGIVVEYIEIAISGDRCLGILTDYAMLSMNGGTILATGVGSRGVHVNYGAAYLRDVKIYVTGDSGTGIEIFNGYAELTGSTRIDTPGSNSVAVQITGSGSAMVVTQQSFISATASDSYALRVAPMGSGAIVYLEGVANGAIEVAGDYGIIIEVDTLDVPGDRHGTSVGLTPVAIGIETIDIVDYYWDTENYPSGPPVVPPFAIILVEDVFPGNNYMYYWSIVVAADATQGTNPGAVPASTTTPATGDNLFGNVVFALLASALLGGASLTFRRLRRQD